MNTGTPPDGGLARIRDGLKQEFVRAAETGASRSTGFNRRARVLAAAVVVAVAAPGAVAAAGTFDGDGITISTDGNTVEVNGQPIDCPAADGGKYDIGLDPCHVLTEPAPPPLSLQQGAGDSADDLTIPADEAGDAP